MKTKKIIMGLVLSCATLSLLACSNDGSAQDGSSNKGNDTNVLTCNDGTEVKSTVVNCYMPSPAGLQTKLEADFEATYPGIDMVLTSGTTGELEAKIEAEKANPICDVLILASWSDGISVINDYDLLAYTPKNADKVVEGFKESTNKIWGTSASAVGVIYNTDLIKKEVIENLDWSDFGDSTKFNSNKYPFAIPDPTLSGACKDFLAGYVSSVGETNAWKVFDSWIANGITNGGGNKPALASVENGSCAVLVGGVDYNAYTDKKKTAIDIYYPKGGTVANPRPAMIMTSGAHNDAAKLVMDYLLSDSAQKLVADALLIPGRSDVNADSSRTSLKDLTLFTNLNWENMANNGSTVAQTFTNKLAKK